MIELGMKTLPIVGVTGFIIGLVIAMQLSPVLKRFGAEAFLPGSVGISIVRELGPVICALIFAGRVSSGIGAELGSMRVTEQIDAMEVSGVYPFRYLVVTRIFATTFILPILTVYVIFISLIGAYIAVVLVQNMTWAYYLDRVIFAVEFGDAIPGVAKTFVFGFIVGLVGCYKGYTAENGTEGVGTASSVTLTDSNVTILVEDCPNAYADFSRLEIRNASSAVTVSNLTITALGTTAPGNIEVFNDAAFTLNSPVFNGLGTFVLDANTDFNAPTFNGCGLITLNEADISNGTISGSTVAADVGAVLDNRTTTSPTTISELDNCTFVQGTNAHHAIDFGTGVDDDITLTGIEFTGFDETSGEDQPGAALRFLATSGSLTCNLVGCTVGGAGASATNLFKDDAAGVAVTLAFDTITLQVTVLDATDDTAITTAHVQLLKDSDKSVLLSGAVNGSGVISTSIAFDTDTDVVGWAREHNVSGTDYTPQDFSGQYTANGFAITIRLVPAE